MIPLQAEIGMGVFEQLADYGVLGLLTLGLGFIVWNMMKRQLASEDRLKSQVEDLQKEMTTYVRTDRDRVTQAVENNTKALNDLKDVILKKR
jgi:hypothetical protein